MMSYVAEKALDLLSSRYMSNLTEEEFKLINHLLFLAKVYNMSELEEFIINYVELKKDLKSKARQDVITALRATRVAIYQQLRPVQKVLTEEIGEEE